MSAMTNAEKLGYLEAYQAATGANRIVADDFARWVQRQPDHPLYERFFGDDDASAAWEARVHRVRLFVSSVRVVVRQVTHDVPVVTVKPREVPAYVSPVESRDAGGGYVRYDPENPLHRDEMRRQGRQALRSWLLRFGTFFDADELALAVEVLAVEPEKAAAA